MNYNRHNSAFNYYECFNKRSLEREWNKNIRFQSKHECIFIVRLWNMTRKLVYFIPRFLQDKNIINDHYKSTSIVNISEINF